MMPPTDHPDRTDHQTSAAAALSRCDFEAEEEEDKDAISSEISCSIVSAAFGPFNFLSQQLQSFSLGCHAATRDITATVGGDTFK